MIPKLEVTGLSYSYHTMEGETLALSNLNFTIETGEFVAVVGPSGCGKSTLLSILSGLIPYDQGEIRIDGVDLSESRANIGYMLQKDHLFEWRTIRSNAALGLEIQNKLDGEHMERLSQLFHTYGLGNFQDAKPSELSGGMRQRVALIRTLILEPDILLLDEPFSALDYQTRLEVCDDISSIIKKARKTAILITHDLSEAVSVADRIIILSKRPARIKTILSTPFEPPYVRPLERRNAPEFSGYFNQVWQELQRN